ncbi:MAG: SAM-dependent chlorinase/fluorinase [Owenweeksia sp.]
MPVITLTSDYGLTDHYLAAVKGVIISELNEVSLVDISHAIQPGNFYEASFILRNCYESFPDGTVHLVAVHEITENKRLLAAEVDDQFFLTADNGLLSMINPEIKVGRVVEINLRQEETLFPARDILAKAACHLARGGSIGLLGREVKDYKESVLMRPRIPNEGSLILGSVLYVDNFGNLITNISHKTFSEVGKDRAFEIALPRRQVIRKIQESYYPASKGSVVALFNSQHLLEIALSEARGKFYNGANTLLGVGVQDTITVTFK